ncbi:MAG: nuclear transport factor 2 family protein [Gammaproteobacteria bacterium]
MNAFASPARVLFAAMAALPLLAACTDGEKSEVDAAALASAEKQVAELESAVRQVADDSAILQNELKYTRGLDRHDEKLSRDAFWPDAIITYGNVIPPNDIGTWANSVHSKRAAHQHHVTGLTLDVDGDTAHEEGYILFTADVQRDTSADTNGVPSPGRVLRGSKATLGTGRYVNRYERRDGQWKMAVHEYVHDLSVSFEPVDLCATACMGRWDPADLSYQRPLQALSESERGQRIERGKKPTEQLLP